MSIFKQTTIDQPATLSGIGLHSGQPVKMTLRPAPMACGLIFRRTDLLEQNFSHPHDRDFAYNCVSMSEAQKGQIQKEQTGSHDEAQTLLENAANDTKSLIDDYLLPACASRVVSTQLGTCIANNVGVKVATIEHLMAALSLMGIRNILIDIDAEEVPILDGSAMEFVDTIKRAGMQELDGFQTPFVVSEPIEYRDEDRFIKIDPISDNVCDLELDVEIDFDDTAIGRQSVHLSLNDHNSLERLSFARTFCMLNSVSAMREAGLCQGGSLENAIVVDDGKLLNGEVLRDPQEFALHKALDLVGDLALLGAPLVGRITAFKPGHDINNKFCRQLQAKMGLGQKRERAIAAA